MPADSRSVARKLTDEQQQAVARRAGSLLLAAGAGSGKTSVLVERFARAVVEDGLAPAKILAITFTERAAGELRERVRARLLELGQASAARATENAFIGTFHGFCARLLRNHPLQAGVEPGFRILDEGFANRLQALAFREALGAFVEGEREQAVDLVAAYGPDQLRALVLGAHAQLRSQGQRRPELPMPQRPSGPQQLSLELEAGDGEERLREQAVAACASIGALLESFDAAYESRKQARGVLDFDDLELTALALLEHREDLRAAWAERFELLMVDEFQDSNPRQLRLLAALDRDNLFTVGDELQSIYGFRHAEVGLFRERRERLARSGAALALTRNFRSHPAIIAAVQRIFAERMGERFAPLQAAVAPQDEHGGETQVELLLTDRRGWERVPGAHDLEGMPQATPWREAEARLLAARVAELIEDGHARAGEIVLLLRSLGDLPVYESALRHRGLPTLAGAGGFWSHQQVGDLLAWLRALANPLDELALYSTLASPLVGLSSDGLALVSAAAARAGGAWNALELSFGAEQGESGLAELSLPDPDRKRLRSFHALFASERRTMALHPIAELLRRAMGACGYERHVLSLVWGERRLANVHKLVRLAREFEVDEGRDLRGFLDHVAHAEAELRGREADAPVAGEELEAVRLMSIHAAKGLEFPVVCVVDLGREPNLRLPDLLVDAPTSRVGLRLQDLANLEPVPALHYEELCEERRQAQLEEEDRILYVACTRAERRLLLSGAVAFERWPAPRPTSPPIAWLAPMLVPDAPGLAESAAQSSFPLRIDTGEELPVRLVLNVALEADGKIDATGPAIDATGPALDATGPALDATGPARPVGPDAPSNPTEPETEPVFVGVTTGVAEPPPLAPATAGPSAPLAPLSDPDATTSYTALSELERCGYRYYLERVLRFGENRAAARAEQRAGSVQARARGTIVHALLEAIDLNRPLAPSPQEVGFVARRIGVRLDLAGREEISNLLLTALAAPPAQELARGAAVRREHPFAFSLSDSEPLVTGVFDLVLDRPDGSMLIVDYKSDRLGGGEDLELLVQRDYGTQRLVYALAAIEAGATSVEIAHWFLERPERWQTANFAASEADSLRARLLERVAALRARGFAVTDDPHREICLTCPGRGGLCSWGETRTLRERSSPLEFQG